MPDISSLWSDIHGTIMNIECDNAWNTRVHGNAPSLKYLWAAHNKIISCKFLCDKCKCQNNEFCEEVEMALAVIDAYQHGKLT